MSPTPLPAELLAAIPGITARLGLILGNLAALIARAFLKDPRHVACIVPLWGYITRTARRFAGTLDRLAAGKLRPHTPRPHTPRHSGQISATPRKPRGYPTTRAWLRATLAHQANGYGSQLTHLLDAPETRALLAAAPQAARLLRPLCRMLGIEPEAIRRPPRPRPPRPEPPRPELRPPELRPPEPRRAPPSAEPAVCTPRPVPPLCPRLRDRWPWNMIAAASPA